MWMESLVKFCSFLGEEILIRRESSFFFFFIVSLFSWLIRQTNLRGKDHTLCSGTLFSFENSLFVQLWEKNTTALHSAPLKHKKQSFSLQVSWNPDLNILSELKRLP